MGESLGDIDKLNLCLISLVMFHVSYVLFVELVGGGFVITGACSVLFKRWKVLQGMKLLDKTVLKFLVPILNVIIWAL